jgi:hypothetical protein
MRSFFLFLFLNLIGSSILSAQSTNAIKDGCLPQQLNLIYRQIDQINKLPKQYLRRGLSPKDLIIGLYDPDEEVTIEGSYHLVGNIIIYQNGVLNISESDFSIDGDILILNNGKLNITDSRFTVIQDYIYEHNAVIVQNAQLTFSDVHFQSSGQSWSIAVAESAKYYLGNSVISDGYITTSLINNGQGMIINSELPGEFLCFDNSRLNISGSDQLIMWIVTEDSTVVETSLPGDSLLLHFQFSDSEPNIDKVNYSVTLDSCTGVEWGLISITGSNALIHDTEFRAAGLMFKEPDSIAVKNLTNCSYFQDDIIDVPDRTLHLINSQVQTWNFYTSSNSNVSFDNCIFGELLAFDSSKAVITNSICDGTGGYLGADHRASLFVIGSLIMSQVISKKSAVLIGALSAFMGSEIVASESSIMFIANTETFVEPESYESAVIFEANLPPVEGFVDSVVPILGTARLIAGPLNPIQFSGYQVQFVNDSDDFIWQSVDGKHLVPMIQDTLAFWNTNGLTPGNYNMQLILYHSYGDSISTGSYARLDANTVVQFNGFGETKSFLLEQNFPNPFNSITVIPYYLSYPSPVTLQIYDVLGREVARLNSNKRQFGECKFLFDARDLPGGVYYYLIQAGSISETRKFILVR